MDHTSWPCFVVGSESCEGLRFDGSCFLTSEGGSFAAGFLTILIVAIRGALQLAGWFRLSLPVSVGSFRLSLPVAVLDAGFLEPRFALRG